MRLRLVRHCSDSDCGPCTVACVTGESYAVVQYMTEELGYWGRRRGMGTNKLRVLIETILRERWAVCRPDPYPTVLALADDPRVSTPRRVVLLIRRTGSTGAHWVTYAGRRRMVYDNERETPSPLESYPHRRWRVLRVLLPRADLEAIRRAY
jgi:hypothetical protein